MSDKEPIKTLEQTLVPHLRERMPHERRGTLAHLQEALKLVRAMLERIDMHGMFSFEKCGHDLQAITEGRMMHLPELLKNHARRETGHGIVVCASVRPKMAKWCGGDRFTYDPMEDSSQTFADKISAGDDAASRLVRAALDITFEPWGGSKCFGHDLLSLRMQRELHEGAMRVMTSLLTNIVFNPHEGGYAIELLTPVVANLPTAIPWRESTPCDWLMVTG